MANRFALWQRWRRLILRVIAELSIPTVCAIAWGFISHVQGATAFASISTGWLAFGFVLFAQGQILRMAKNVRDEDDASEIRDSFASISQAINALRAQGFSVHQPQRNPGPAEVSEPPIGYIHSTRPIPLGFNDFLAQARRAIDSGQYYTAVLLAAVGFEAAARECADQLGIDSKRMSLGRLARELGQRTENNNAEGTLSTLAKLRNSVVHAEKEMQWVDRAQAEDLINALTVGAQYLEMVA